MKMTFTFKHLDHSESLVAYANDKFEEVMRLLLTEGHGHCYFSKTRHLFVVEVALNTKLRFYKASSEKPDIYAAFDEVVSKLEKQFLKTRKTHQDHKKMEHSRWGRLNALNGKFENLLPLKKAA